MIGDLELVELLARPRTWIGPCPQADIARQVIESTGRDGFRADQRASTVVREEYVGIELHFTEAQVLIR